MEIVDINSCTLIKNPHGVEARKLYESDDLQLVQLSLKLGDKLIKHSFPIDMVFIVLEGSGVAEIGKEKQKVFKNSLIYSPKNVPHSFYNDSDSDFKLLAIKSPKPSEEQTREAVKNMLTNKRLE